MAKNQLDKSKDIEELENVYKKITNSEGSKPKKESSIKKGALIIGILILVGCLVLGIGGYFLFHYINESRTIQANITVCGVNVQGLNRAQATEAINEAFAQAYSSAALKVTIGDDTVTLSPATMQIVLDTGKLVKDALNYKQDAVDVEAYSIKAYIQLDKDAIINKLQPIADKYESTLVQTRYVVNGSAPTQENEAASQEILITVGTPGIHVDTQLAYTAILESLADGIFTMQFDFPVESPKDLDLEAIFAEYCVAPTDAVMDPETFSITKEKSGYGFHVETVKEMLANAAAGQVLKIPFETLTPSITEEIINQSLYKDVLGEITTYATSIYDRNINLRVACESIDGKIVLPGEIFSFNDTLGNRIPENGYRPGNSYVNGEVVQTYGGGICQVSSALYYATVLADLEIVERYCHAYYPTYIPYATDATVAWGYLDYRFKNNTDRPIKLIAEADGGTVTIQILGVETRDYYVKFRSETISWVNYKTVYKEFDEDNEDGYKDGDIISSPCSGVIAKSYREKYNRETGELISSTLENHDKYDTRDKVVAKIKKPEPAPTPAPSPTPTPTSDPAPTPTPTSSSTSITIPTPTPGSTSDTSENISQNETTV